MLTAWHGKNGMWKLLLPLKKLTCPMNSAWKARYYKTDLVAKGRKVLRFIKKWRSHAHEVS